MSNKGNKSKVGNIWGHLKKLSLLRAVAIHNHEKNYLPNIFKFIQFLIYQQFISTLGCMYILHKIHFSPATKKNLFFFPPRFFQQGRGKNRKKIPELFIFLNYPPF